MYVYVYMCMDVDRSHPGSCGRWPRLAQRWRQAEFPRPERGTSLSVCRLRHSPVARPCRRIRTPAAAGGLIVAAFSRSPTTQPELKHFVYLSLQIRLHIKLMWIPSPIFSLLLIVLYFDFGFTQRSLCNSFSKAKTHKIPLLEFPAFLVGSLYS